PPPVRLSIHYPVTPSIVHRGSGHRAACLQRAHGARATFTHRGAKATVGVALRGKSARLRELRVGVVAAVSAVHASRPLEPAARLHRRSFPRLRPPALP